ncbi:MAG TPA: hypothetical protein VGP97_15845 [Burkholderiales bacterium]|jgi:hypothetical protein|nr:hypothetical protein [Burkholderiales bacterium]
MPQNDEKLKKTVAGFAVLLTAVTEMVRTRAVKPAVLDAYDDAADQIIDGLRGNSISDAELQAIHKALARLRLAFEEQKS